MSEQVMVVSSAIPFEEEVYLNGLKERKLIINQEVDDSLVERAIMQIINWNEEDKDKNSYDKKTIKIYLNSPGGEIGIGLTFCDVIKNSKTPVHIISLGYAASMGALIFMSGHHRIAYPSSSFLIHDGSIMLGGSTSKIKDTMKYQEEIEDRVKQLILSSSKITEEKYKEMYEKEWWLSAKSAKEYGFVDEIIGE